MITKKLRNFNIIFNESDSEKNHDCLFCHHVLSKTVCSHFALLKKDDFLFI